MTAKNEISEELKGLSEVVAGIDRFLPYEGPGVVYFENLAPQVLKRLGEGIEMGGDPSLSTVLQRIKQENGFSVPEGYFEGFASRMLDRVRMEAGQAQGAGKVQRLGQVQDAGRVQDVEGRDIAVSEVDKELAGLSSLLQSIGKKMPFLVPEDYFGRLSVPEEAERSLVLADLKGREVFRVPEGYFEHFPEDMVARANSGVMYIDRALPGVAGELEAGTEQEGVEQEARVIQLPWRKGRMRWLTYASMGVAASVVLVVGWLSLHKPGATGIASVEVSNADISNKLAKVSDQDIQNYLEIQHPALDEELASSTAAADISASDLSGMLGEVSDAELKEYLEDHGNLKDLPTN